MLDYSQNGILKKNKLTHFEPKIYFVFKLLHSVKTNILTLWLDNIDKLTL